MVEKVIDTRKNLIIATDSYKLGHWNQYPSGTQGVYSYMEAREGATYPDTVFFGLQPLLMQLKGPVVNERDLQEASDIAYAQFGRHGMFNYRGWLHIVNEHNCHLPLRIKAVPEGTPVPVGNVMMTVENTCPECYWLTNAMESFLTHVWYPSTVATISHHTIRRIARFLERTADSMDGLPYMLHDFGYRGVSSDESANFGGAGHLVSSRGTDTVSALKFVHQYYDMPYEEIGYSVPATEHSIMTSLGERGEEDVVDQLLEKYPEGILSVVADSYDVYRFAEMLGRSFYRDRIMSRDGVFVMRPDSVTTLDPTPESLMVTLSEVLWERFGGRENAKGYKVLDPHVRLLWGDGIDPQGIEDILSNCTMNGFSAENYVFGMGGGLLQKNNRDTQRFAFKASAQKRDGIWHNVHKTTHGKSSKAGRLALVNLDGEYQTLPYSTNGVEVGSFEEKVEENDLLRTVFDNGQITKKYTFQEIREASSVPTGTVLV